MIYSCLDDGLLPGLPEHIHHADDGRGYRRVILDGREFLPEVFYADTNLGLVSYWVQNEHGNVFTLPPYHDCLAWAEAYGRVTIELKETT